MHYRYHTIHENPYKLRNFCFFYFCAYKKCCFFTAATENPGCYVFGKDAWFYHR